MDGHTPPATHNTKYFSIIDYVIIQTTITIGAVNVIDYIISKLHEKVTLVTP